MMKSKTKLKSILFAFVMIVCSIVLKGEANAATDYPVQEIQITNSNGYSLSLKG